LKGKIAYMAPEQAAADDALDRRADVFAGGIVLWEVLTGRRLFKSTNDAATLSRVVSERIDPPVSIIEGLDTRISDICMKALERPLTRRYQTAALFADQLEQAANRRGLLASNKEVAAYVHRVLGEEIHQQREAVRRWVAVSDCTDDLTPSGSVRAPSSRPRGERFSSPPDAPQSSSQMRRVGSRPDADAGPNDVTMAALPPRSAWMTYRRRLIVGAVALVAMGGGVSGYLRHSAPVALASARPFVIGGQVPATTALAPSPAAGAGGASTVPSVDASAFATVPEVFAAQPAPLATAQPASSGGPNYGTKPKSSVPSTKVPAITDVDLTNPYR
jgi:serine/threonine-protein kinase